MKSTIDHLTKLAEQIKQITEAEVHRGSIYGPSFDRNKKAQLRKEADEVNDWYRQDSEKEKAEQEKLTIKPTPSVLAKYVQEAEQHQYQPMPGDTVSFDINEELEITAEVTDIVADGVVLNLDETALRLLGGLTLITEEYDQSHGSPYDRGSADSHYGRDKKPHRWWDKLGQQREELTDPADIAAYHAGYDENQRSGDKKQWDESDSTSHGVMGLHGRVNEAEYHGRDVALGKPMRTSGGPKKFSVYVRDPKTGNVKKVNFGDPNMEIKRDDPARRKNFRARHGCGTGRASNRTKAAYWSCKMWSKKPVSKIVKEELEYQINEVSDEVQVNETIVKRGDEYCVVSKSKDSKGHHKNLGCSDTQAGAKRRMGQVEYFKHQGEDSAD
jgi:hypothetical protein